MKLSARDVGLALFAIGLLSTVAFTANRVSAESVALRASSCFKQKCTTDDYCQQPGIGCDICWGDNRCALVAQ